MTAAPSSVVLISRRRRDREPIRYRLVPGVCLTRRPHSGPYNPWDKNRFVREASLSTDGFLRARPWVRATGIGAVVVLIAAYLVAVSLYASAGLGQPRQVTEGHPAPDGTTVTIDLKDVHSIDGQLIADVTVAPGPGLLDPVSHDLTQDLSVVVTSAVTPTKHTWSKGMLPGVFPVPLNLTGDVTHWPFDDYHSGPITVELFRGTPPASQRAPVTFVDRLRGWRVDVPGGSNANDSGPYRVELQRSPSTAAFAAAVVGVLILLAGLALFVAVQTLRGRRKFQPPMTTWYGTMLFAVVPLRNALPDSPPIGWWVDVTVVLWVIVVLGISMLIYIYCWWRDLRPDPDKPA